VKEKENEKKKRRAIIILIILLLLTGTVVGTATYKNYKSSNSELGSDKDTTNPSDGNEDGSGTGSVGANQGASDSSQSSSESGAQNGSQNSSSSTGQGSTGGSFGSIGGSQGSTGGTLGSGGSGGNTGGGNTGGDNSGDVDLGDVGGGSNTVNKPGTSETVNITLSKKDPVENEKFNINNMFPGDTEIRYYRIKIDHSKDINLKFSVDVDKTSKLLSQVLKFKVELPEENVVLYDGTLANMPSEVNYVVKADASSTKEILYKVTAYLDTNVDNKYAQQDLSANFSWKASSY
jgi:hypothetical protein